MNFTHIEGIDKGKITLYAISTCMWCKKTKNFLNSLGVAYDYVDVDLLSEQERESAEKEVIRWKNNASYPAIIINDEECVPVFNKSEIKEALNIK